MTVPFAGPVLLVCADGALAARLLDQLYAQGIEAVGPAPTAGLALTLAGQTMTPVALLAGETSGRRSASELAEELARTWGVRCCQLTPEAIAGAEPGRDPIGRLRDALAAVEAPSSPH